jgi:hypothetical protein
MTAKAKLATYMDGIKQDRLNSLADQVVRNETWPERLVAECETPKC